MSCNVRMFDTSELRCQHVGLLHAILTNRWLAQLFMKHTADGVSTNIRPRMRILL